MKGCDTELMIDTTAEGRCTAAELDAMLTEIAAGDLQALEQLYRRTRASVYAFALSVLKNPQDAEDVLHDCYVAVWNGAAGYHSQGKPLAWLITVARNLCFQRIRQQKKTEDMRSEEWALCLPCERGLSPEDRSILSVCMEQLSGQERQIVALHAVSGFKHREIAELMDLPLPTVLSKYHRAVKRLKKIMQ